MVAQREARTRARRRDLELVHDFLPQLVVTHALGPAPQNCGLEEFAQIQLFAANRRNFEVLVPHLLLEFD